MDLFEEYEQQPEFLKKICNKWADKYARGEGLTYYECQEFLEEVEAVGYTFEYYLDAEPYNLRKK
jgi:hypothetical protein